MSLALADAELPLRVEEITDPSHLVIGRKVIGR